MKNKFLSFVLAICMIISCAFVLSACKSNSTSENAKELTKKEYAQAFKGVQSAYNSYINEGGQASGSSLMSVSINDSDLITIDRENQLMRMSTACVQFVGFLENLCENETFKITNDFQEMLVVDTSIPNYTQNFMLRVKMAYDKDSGLIKSEVYCEDSSYKTYLVFDILYDFKTEKLDYFTITGAMGELLTTSSVNYFKFKNNTFKMLPQGTEVFNAYAQEILATCNALETAAWSTNLPDYSKEYVDAMLGN